MAGIRPLNAVLCCLASGIFILNGCSGSSGDDAAKLPPPENIDTVRRLEDNKVKVFSAGTGSQMLVRNVFVEDLSVIYVVSQPEVELLMAGPDGRRTGKPPDSSKPLEEIPNSSYYDQYIEDPEGESGMETRHLEIRRPADGDYLLSVFSAQNGNYDMGIRIYDIKGRQYSWDRHNIPMTKDSVHTYRISFRKDGGEELVNADTLK